MGWDGIWWDQWRFYDFGGPRQNMDKGPSWIAFVGIFHGGADFEDPFRGQIYGALTNYLLRLMVKPVLGGMGLDGVVVIVQTAGGRRAVTIVQGHKSTTAIVEGERK